MFQPVAHANDGAPWNVRMLVTRFLGNFIGGLANDFYGSHHSYQQHLVRGQGLALPPCGKAQQSLTSLDHVQNAYPIFSLHTAPVLCG